MASRVRSIRKPLHHGDLACVKLGGTKCAWVSVDSRMIRVSDGSVVGYRGTLQDPTPGFTPGDRVLVRAGSISRTKPAPPLVLTDLETDEAVQESGMSLLPLALIAGGLAALVLISK